MSTQPEALRLADALDAWDGKLMMPKGWRESTADELRRLHTLLEAEQALHQRTTYPELRRLHAQRDALLETLRHAAAIAHSGGLQGMTEWQSLVAVRRLTQPYFERSGSITETHDRLRAAIAKAEGET